MTGDPITAGVREFCRLSGLSRGTVYKMLKAGEIDGISLHGRRLIVLASYHKLVESAPRDEPISHMGRRVGRTKPAA